MMPQHLSPAEQLAQKNTGIKHFKAGMCLSRFSWYLPLNSHQHVYTQHCERAETSAGVYLAMRGAGWSHSSLDKLSRFY